MKKGLIGTAITVGLGALAFAGRVLWDVFSLAGIAYAFGIGDGADLFAPTATIVVFWALAVLIAVEGPVLVVMRLDRNAGHLTPGSRREAWLAAHVSLARRVHERKRWAMVGWDNYLAQRDRAAHLAYGQVPVRRPGADRADARADQDAA